MITNDREDDQNMVSTANLSKTPYKKTTVWGVDILGLAGIVALLFWRVVFLGWLNLKKEDFLFFGLIKNNLRSVVVVFFCTVNVGVTRLK